MNWIQYLPPILSLYLLLISGVSSAFLASSVSNFVARKDKLQQHEEVIKNIALSWSTRLGFFNAMFASGVSLASIWASTKSFDWLVGMAIPLLFLFIPMMWWIASFSADELTGTVIARVKMKPSTFIRLVLLSVNLLIIFAIWASHNLVSVKP